MGTDRYDEALIQILQAEGKIVPFLDVVFGFLQRRTDFYHEHARPSAVGFPPGVAEQLVVTTFRKWREVQRRASSTEAAAAETAVPPAVVEEEVVTSHASVTSPTVTSSTKKVLPGQKPAAAAGDASNVSPPGKAAGTPPRQTTDPARSQATTTSSVDNRNTRGSSGRSTDTHNGAARDAYSWSQTITDLTVQVPVPPDVKRARQVSVDLQTDRVSVRLVGGKELMSGRLHRPVRAEESTWSLLPGECIQLSLEKSRECWWKAVLEGELEIDLGKIEAVKPWEDLSEEEQMKVNELRAKEEAKRTGKSAGGGRSDVSKLLKEAWDAEGSPFKGQPYDPSVVQMISGAAASGDGGGSGGEG